MYAAEHSPSTFAENSNFEVVNKNAPEKEAQARGPGATAELGVAKGVAWMPTLVQGALKVY
jgi:hypothetical protein